METLKKTYIKCKHKIRKIYQFHTHIGQYTKRIYVLKCAV